jgi:ribulose-phosphate 3-epimerase
MAIALAAAMIHADFKRLTEQIRTLESGGIDRFHFDIMDGHFVPAFAFSPAIIGSLRSLSQRPFEVHLMIERPEQYIEAVAQSGATTIIIHAEATVQLRRVISTIRRAGCKIGVAINPTTTPDTLGYVLPDIDSVLLLSADVGADQPFATTTRDKIQEVRNMITDLGLETEIVVDGGLTTATITDCVRAGAKSLVLGSALFQNMPNDDLAEAVQAVAIVAAEAEALGLLY